MSDVLTLQGVMLNSGVSGSVIDQISRQINPKLDFNTLLEIVYSSDRVKLREAVKTHLKRLNDHKSDKVQWNNAADIRIFFESINAVTIARKMRDDKILKEKLTNFFDTSVQELQAQIEHFDENPTASTHSFWERDADFHRTLIEFGGHPNLQLILETVLEVCAAQGTGKNKRHLEKALQEHQDIIDAIRLKKPIEEKVKSIVGACCKHIRTSLTRWLDMDVEGPSAELLNIQAADHFYQMLPELMKTHHQEWVVFSGLQPEPIAFGKSNTEVHKKCLKKGMNPQEFSEFYIDEPICMNTID